MKHQKPNTKNISRFNIDTTREVCADAITNFVNQIEHDLYEIPLTIVKNYETILKNKGENVELNETERDEIYQHVMDEFDKQISEMREGVYLALDDDKNIYPIDKPNS
jgi:hypothetical protein